MSCGIFSTTDATPLKGDEWSRKHETQVTKATTTTTTTPGELFQHWSIDPIAEPPSRPTATASQPGRGHHGTQQALVCGTGGALAGFVVCLRLCQLLLIRRVNTPYQGHQAPRGPSEVSHQPRSAMKLRVAVAAPAAGRVQPRLVLAAVVVFQMVPPSVLQHASPAQLTGHRRLQWQCLQSWQIHNTHVIIRDGCWCSWR
jgi:hypothetical protein